MYLKTVDASVIVAVRDDHRLEILLDSLGKQDCFPFNFEVLIIENGTHVLESLVDKFRHAMEIRYFLLPQSNSAAARNVGLRNARGRYILMTDADAIASPTWVRTLIDSLDNSGHGAVGGTIRKASLRTWVQRSAITIVDGQSRLNYLPASPLPYLVGANVAYRAELMREVGGFDEELKSGADVDICYKIGYAGKAIGLCLDAVIFHEDRSTLREHFRRFAFYAEYQVLLFAKHKRQTGKNFIVNTYPILRALSALVLSPAAVGFALIGRMSLLQRVITQLIEVTGIWWGSCKGAIKYRQFYI